MLLSGYFRMTYRHSVQRRSSTVVAMGPGCELGIILELGHALLGVQQQTSLTFAWFALAWLLFNTFDGSQPRRVQVPLIIFLPW